MKSNRTLFIALAAGAAVAGLIGFLLATEKGRQVTKKWKGKGSKLANQIDEIIREGKEKIAGLRREAARGDKRSEKFAEEY